MCLIDESMAEDVHPGQVNLADPGWPGFQYALFNDEVLRARRMREAAAAAQAQVLVHDLKIVRNCATGVCKAAGNPRIEILAAASSCNVVAQWQECNFESRQRCDASPPRMNGVGPPIARLMDTNL